MTEELIVGLLALGIPLFGAGYLMLRRNAGIFRMFLAMLIIGLGYLGLTGALDDVGRTILGKAGVATPTADTAPATEETAPAPAPESAPATEPATPPAAETPAAETPAETPASTEAPAADTAPAEAPATEAPAPETPSTETPSAPSTEQPASEPAPATP